MAPRTRKAAPPPQNADLFPAARSSSPAVTEWLKVAGERVNALGSDLQAREARIAELEAQLAHAESQRHEALLENASLVADLAKAGERIVDLEADLREAREQATLFAEAAAEAGAELVSMEQES